jgi:SAM-dependent methyltransferase
MSEDYREESLDRWEAVAAAWKAARPAFQRMAMPLSRWMVEAIHPQPGHRVLELGAGPGDTGLLAAELVAPGGSVIITDGAQAMVAVARERAAEVGVGNVELRAMQAEWIDLPAASVDGVLGRFVYMLLADPEAALRETRRVLRPGGRVALAVWDDVAHNPWMAVARGALEAQGHAPAFPPDQPGPFSLSAPGAVAEVLETAGFDEVEVEPVDLVFEAPSLDAWWDQIVTTSSTMGETVRGLSPAEHYALREAVDAGYASHVRDDGSLQLPARALAAAATA